jgi:hypothetical protein
MLWKHCKLQTSSDDDGRQGVMADFLVISVCAVLHCIHLLAPTPRSCMSEDKLVV